MAVTGETGRDVVPCNRLRVGGTSRKESPGKGAQETPGPYVIPKMFLVKLSSCWVARVLAVFSHYTINLNTSFI